MELVSKTKKCSAYTNNAKNIHVFIGRNQHSNQQLLNDFCDVSCCFWFHLDVGSSAHIVLTYENSATYNDLIAAFKWVRTQLKRDHSDDEVIFCKMQNVKSTKTKGEVTFTDETRMDHEWTQALKKEMLSSRASSSNA